MSERCQQRQYDISASAFTLSPRTLLFGRYATFTRFLNQANYIGYQMPYIRRPDAGRLQRRLLDEGYVTSFHQSFATGSGLENAKYRVPLSSVEMSLHRLAHLQRDYIGQLPIVVHPDEQWLDNEPPDRLIDYRRWQAGGRFSALLHQPTVEVLDAWKVLSQRRPRKTAQDMLVEQAVRGFDGVALDLHHLTARRADKQLPKAWCYDFVSELARTGGLAPPNEIQLSYRSDFGGDPTSMSRVLRHGLAATLQGDLLLRAASDLPPCQRLQNITVESPPREFAGTGMGLWESHRELVGLMRDELPQPEPWA